MISLQPIGLIRSPWSSLEETPIQPSRSRAMGSIELLPEYEEGLKDLDGFSHIFLLYLFHKCEPGFRLTATPFLDSVPKGLFATRYPRRPNPIGLSVVRLMAIAGRFLHVEGIDVLDGTPLIDIKPYVPPFDSVPGASFGWLEGRA